MYVSMSRHLCVFILFRTNITRRNIDSAVSRVEVVAVAVAVAVSSTFIKLLFMLVIAVTIVAWY